MSDLILSLPVHTLENQELLPAGSVLSEETLNGLVSSNKQKSYQEHSLIKYGLIKEDLITFLKMPPYHMIFSEKNQIPSLLELIENVHLVLPVLQSLDYFKKNDFYTYRHILMVVAMSTFMTQFLVSDHKDRLQETATGPTHDIGKYCVAVDILRKPDPLTKTELNALEHHATAGYVLLSYYLKNSQSLSAIVARDHHERKNGSGYPRGILLDNIMVEIVSVTDIYDALISARPYRPIAYDNRTALEEITFMAEKNDLSWNVVKALVSLCRKDKPHYTELKISAEKRGTPPPGNVYGVVADEKKKKPEDDNI